LSDVKRSFKVIRSALRMQYQDIGRFGYAHLGVTQGGALDLHAYCWANFLLGNDAGVVCLEITLGNVEIEVLEDVEIAITGAEMHVTCDGEVLKNWASHVVKKGQVLKWGHASRGNHQYLAVKRGFVIPMILGSASTVMRNDLGRNLVENDFLSCSVVNLTDSNRAFILKQTPSAFIPDYAAFKSVRVILAEGLESEMMHQLLENKFTVSPQSDRMGINLISDQQLERLPGILSEGMALGAIQLPPSGHPVVLMNDRQTQGGYAKVGTVARLDVFLLLQVHPFSKVTFSPVSMSDACAEWVEFSEFFGL